MFNAARIRLTTWYLVIIMTTSLLFSLTIYNLSTRELRRVVSRIQMRQMFDEPFPISPPPLRGPSLEELQQSEQNLRITLLLINGIILVIAGTAGYFLAGRTLQPIQDMLDEQRRFISDASHELKTPLTAMRTEIEVYETQKKKSLKDAETLLKSNLEEVVELQSLTENLIQLARYEGSQTIVFAKLSLLDIIENSLKKVTPLARNKGIRIQNNIGEENVEGDKRSLTELFTIIIDNAIKYSPKDAKIIITSSHSRNTTEIKIIDKGIGMKKQDITHVFDRFYRADSARTKQEVSGYGLGLSIAKQIVEKHNGSIHIYSEYKKGTAVTIQLPSIQAKT